MKLVKYISELFANKIATEIISLEKITITRRNSFTNYVEKQEEDVPLYREYNKKTNETICYYIKSAYVGIKYINREVYEKFGKLIHE